MTFSVSHTFLNFLNVLRSFFPSSWAVSLEIVKMSLEPNLFEKGTRILTLHPFYHKTYSMEQSPS